MKRKKVMDTVPKKMKTRKNGRVFTAQVADDILILNFYQDRRLTVRYCMNTESGEYGSYFTGEGIWAQRKIADVWGQSFYHSYHDVASVPDTDEDLEAVKTALGIENGLNVFCVIENREYQRNAEMRSNSENNRRLRTERLMARVPCLPGDFKSWICHVAGVEDHAFLDKDNGKLACSSCGGRFPREKESGKKAVHNERIKCPHCKKSLTVKTRTESVRIRAHAMLLQAVDEEQGVARHISVEVSTDITGRHVQTEDEIRIMLYRADRKRNRNLYQIYYATDRWNGNIWLPEWSVTNPANRRMHSEFLYPGGITSEFLYPGGITEALQGTAYGPWKDVFAMLAGDGRKLWYNNLMAGTAEPDLPGIVEYLYKGRFYRLVEEVAEHTWIHSGSYHGILDTANAESAEDIFGIEDRQKINRIRDRNGGEDMVEWMQLSDRTGKKIPDGTLDWIMSFDIRTKDIDFISGRMSPQQVMNYVKKQKETEYPELTEKEILSQWADYLRMCMAAGKDTADEMVYRPRQLKRRHDEIVEERNRLQILEDMQRDEEGRKRAAQELNERFPGAEAVLKEIAPKLSYENGQFRIVVPERLFDIVTEGQALHHCVGSSDRYFDRIMQRETYICFLRRVEEPEVPYYTIEVEPGGTVRQHRSRYDEEPNLEEIRGFLKEWQQVVKRRMDKKDKRYADTSRKKREENIEELRQQNNIRVLQGLKEDFMEVI